MTGKARLDAGRPWPLGGHWDGAGINFALFSANAAAVELCVDDDEGMRVYPLPRRSEDVWHGYLPGARPGLRYAFRVHGPQGGGHRFAPERMLLDPYARALSGEFSYTPEKSSLMAKVPDETFDWGDDRAPGIALEDSILYEIHVKGATRLNPAVPEALRGTYAGLASPAMIAHYRRLGVTAVNLLPVHAFLDEKRLLEAGLTNYWGYNSIAFFAPERRYAARPEEALAEFKAMVRDLHAAGLEIILDVVFNHTAETDENGPTIAFRGIDNASYYRLPADAPERYENFSGTGNTLNLAHPRVLQLTMDALRYWVEAMHVDGFRFDLAAALTRESAFLAAVRQDPVLARVKLIAEPWDLGPDGYRLGRFGPGWSEWNDRFRDAVRAFWLTGEAGAPALAQRLAGSSECFRREGRAPQAGVNFITAHDGFTLHDLVTYQQKHNERNGEENRDGHDRNFSWNCGEEGESDDARIMHRRYLLKRALLATLFVAQGVPMLHGGDEIGRTQAGNNNAYCQDNALTWLDWPAADNELTEFTAGLIALRRRFPQLRRRAWLTGEANAAGRPDVTWWHREGRPFDAHDWQSPHKGALGMLLAPVCESPEAEAVLVLVNRDDMALPVHLPPGEWRVCCDTASRTPFADSLRLGLSSVEARSVQILAQAADAVGEAVKGER